MAKTGAAAVIRALTSFRSHEICCRDCSENDDVSVDTLVSHNSHSATWVDCSIGLGDLVVQTSLANLGDEDIVGLTGNLDLFWSHFP